MSGVSAGFHEVRFPETISYGSSGGPGYNTAILTVDSGAEERVSRWSQGRGQYNVRNGIKKQEDLYALITFYRARIGCAYGFRYKDWTDYATTSEGTTYGGQSTTFADTTIGTGDGTTTTFQLVKQYTSGPVTRTRTITKPVDGTVKIGFNGVNQASGWTCNPTSGIVTFTTAPTNGVVITAGFEFDVPVRFGQEVDKQLEINLEDYRSGSLNVPIIEIMDTGASQDEFNYGGALEVAAADDYSITGITRVWVFNFSTSGKDVILPPASNFPAGGPAYYIVNDGANSFTLRDPTSALSRTLAPGDMVEVIVSVDVIGTFVYYAC